MSPRRQRLPVLVTAVAGVALLLSGIGLAAFDAGSSSGFSVASDRVFPAAHTTAAWSVIDSGAGSAANVTFTTAAAEGRIFTTGTWSSSFSGTGYLDFTYNAPLPGGLTATSVAYSFDFAENHAARLRASTSRCTGPRLRPCSGRMGARGRRSPASPTPA